MSYQGGTVRLVYLISKKCFGREIICMKIKYPDYDNCITNLACSILEKFNISEHGKNLPMCDKVLQKEYKNIVVLLLDGMGSCIIENNLKKDGFFNTHKVGDYSSVFPPTTVAATTSMDSGINPVSHSWLGWDCYFKDIDKNVTVFLNTESENDMPAAEYNVAWRYCPYSRVIDRINKSGQQAHYLIPFAEPYPSTFEELCDNIKETCAKDGKKYIYAYWMEPDDSMHKTGCYSIQSKNVLRQLESQVEELSKQLEDTLLIVTADHGHIDSQGVVITEYSDIMDCLIRMPSIEPRAVNFFVKENKILEFKKVFNKHFKNKFILFTKQQVKETKLFGTGKQHKQFDEMLGDYLAVAIDNLSIFNTLEEKEACIGVHAGLTEDEMTIPLIAIEC